jgi:hypothetical protein
MVSQANRRVIDLIATPLAQEISDIKASGYSTGIRAKEIVDSHGFSIYKSGAIVLLT